MVVVGAPQNPTEMPPHWHIALAWQRLGTAAPSTSLALQDMARVAQGRWHPAPWGIAWHCWVSLGITGCHWALRLPRCWGNAPICPQSLDLWCFDVFALNRVTDDHSLRTIVFELFTRHNLNSRFKVRPCPCPPSPGPGAWDVPAALHA